MTAGGRIDSDPYKENVGLLAVLHATNNASATLGKTGKLTGVLPAYGNPLPPACAVRGCGRKPAVSSARPAIGYMACLCQITC